MGWERRRRRVTWNRKRLVGRWLRLRRLVAMLCNWALHGICPAPVPASYLPWLKAHLSRDLCVCKLAARVTALCEEQSGFHDVVLPLEPEVLDRDAVDAALLQGLFMCRGVGHGGGQRGSCGLEASLQFWAEHWLELPLRG